MSETNSRIGKVTRQDSGSPEFVRNDGVLINLLTKMGTGADKSEATTVGMTLGLSKRNLEELFKVPLLQRVCTALPRSAILKGWQLTLGVDSDQKIIAAFNKYQEALEVAEKFCQAQIQANIYGGAAIVLIIDDGLDPVEPVAEDKIKSIKSLEVLDCHKISPVTDEGIFSAEPEFYQLILPKYFTERFKEYFPVQKAQQSIVGTATEAMKTAYQYQIHASRIIRFDGVELPPDMLVNGWGGSVINSIWEDWRDYKTGLKAAGAMLHDFSLFIYKLKGLADLIRANNELLIQSRLQLLRLMTTVFGGLAIDADGESVEYSSRNFAGVDSIINLHRDSFIGSSGLPHTELFGESPSGLGATGESEKDSWAQQVGAFQVHAWYKKLKRFGKYTFKCKDAGCGGKEPADWGLNFVPLVQLSETDVIANRSTQSQTDSSYLASAVLTAEEIRDSRFSGSKYSIETILDPKAWEAAKKAAAEEAQFGGFEDEAPAEEDFTGDSRLDTKTVFADKALHAKVVAMAKSRFKVFPSRYAGFWISRIYKKLLAQKNK